jgi:hypothetical protein
MGFDSNGVRFLIRAKQLKVNFKKVLTIGRQGLHLSNKEIKNLLDEADLGSSFDEKDVTDNYAEWFLKLLGAEITDSLDISDHDGATFLHDLNVPISNKIKSKYSLVIDGGSLEHVFNFPIAIKSCMELIENGGYYIGITPTNNFFGHGFYQFSPELYFRIFSESNGFKIVNMYFFTSNKGATLYEIKDPLEVKQRITMINAFPSYLFVIAQKVEEKKVFETIPQQSDYEHILWKEKSRRSKLKSSKIIQSIVSSKLYFPIKKILNIYKLTRPIGKSNSDFIRKADKSVK